MRSRPHQRCGLLLTFLLGAVACSGGGSGHTIVIPALEATFTAEVPAGDLSMAAGAKSGSAFEVEIRVDSIPDFFGAAFHVQFDPATVAFVDGDFDAEGSILSGSSPLFFAENIAPGEVAVEASLQGSGAGLAQGTGLLITLHFTASGVTNSNTFEFEPTTAQQVKSCPGSGQPCTNIEGSLSWSGGVLSVF